MVPAAYTIAKESAANKTSQSVLNGKINFISMQLYQISIELKVVLALTSDFKFDKCGSMVSKGSRGGEYLKANFFVSSPDLCYT